jgi:hypothetical protein
VAEDAHAVAADPAIARQFQAPRQLAIIGEQQQPLRAEVEPPDRDDARQAGRQLVEYRGPALGSLWVVISPAGLW